MFHRSKANPIRKLHFYTCTPFNIAVSRFHLSFTFCCVKGKLTLSRFSLFFSLFLFLFSVLFLFYDRAEIRFIKYTKNIIFETCKVSFRTNKLNNYLLEFNFYSYVTFFFECSKIRKFLTDLFFTKSSFCFVPRFISSYWKKIRFIFVEVERILNTQKVYSTFISLYITIYITYTLLLYTLL